MSNGWQPASVPFPPLGERGYLHVLLVAQHLEHGDKTVTGRVCQDGSVLTDFGYLYEHGWHVLWWMEIPLLPDGTEP